MIDIVLDFIEINKIDSLEAFDRRSNDLMFMIRSQIEKNDLFYKGAQAPKIEG